MVALSGGSFNIWPFGIWPLARRGKGPGLSLALSLALPLVGVLLVGGISLLLSGGAQAADSDNDGLDDATELTLAQRFAPRLQFTAKEIFYPVEVAYFIDNSNLNLSNPFGQDPEDPNATVAKLGALTDPDLPFYLDHRAGTINDTGIATHYQGLEASLGYTVYARVVSSGGNVVVQYWFFYAFNTGTLNTHEGDWETIMIVLADNGTTPVKAYYSQHQSGQQAAWSQVEKSGDTPVVYVARGSHANYYRWFQGRMGLAADTVGDDGKVLKPTDYTLVMLGETGAGNHTGEQAWVDYAGRWGDYGPLEAGIKGSRGPQGPAYRVNGSLWATPVSWGEELPALDERILQLERFLANFIKYFVTLIIISLALKLLVILRRQRKTGLGRVFSFLNLDGLNLKSLANLLALTAICLAFYSLVQPWYGVYVEVEAGDYSTDGEVQVFSVDGLEGLRINQLESEGGLSQLVGFPMPFAYVLGLGLVFMVLGTVGLIKTRKVGRKYLFSGIKLLIPVILILGFISQAASVADSAAADMPPEFQELLANVADSPQGGRETLMLGDYGQVHLRWGLEEGGWLLGLSGLLLIVAGLMMQFSRGKMFRDKQEKRQLKDEKQREKETEQRSKEAEKERKEREKEARKQRRQREKEAKQQAKQAGKEQGRDKRKGNEGPELEYAPPQDDTDKPDQATDKEPPEGGGMLKDLL